MILSGSDKKKNIKILLPIWGDSYVKTFIKYSLPSLLAPQNLPFLSSHCQVELILLTDENSAKNLLSNRIFNTVKKIATVTVIPIDDLLVNNYLYGYILTFAYLRGISYFKQNMVDFHFIFLVADYILSENSLSGLLEYINQGHTAIFSSSVRMIKENTDDVFSCSKYWHGHALKVPARKAVEIALENLHPTVFSKIVNQSLSYSKNNQHFFWRVDDKTLISRNFMLHPLCLKPTRVMTDIAGFCDYSFIPELCPGGRIGYLNDSDKFFALELQTKDHELGFLRFGEKKLQEIADNLSEWATEQHRECSHYTYVYHAGDIPENYVKVLEQADRFITSIHSLLSEFPVSHLEHPHWHSNILQFNKLLKNELVPNVRTISSRVSEFKQQSLLARSKKLLRKFLTGSPLQIPIWSCWWADFKILQDSLFHVLKDSKNPLIITDKRALIEWYYNDMNKKAAFLNIEELHKKTIIRHDLAKLDKFDGVVLFLNDTLVQSLSIYLDVLRPNLKNGANIYIYMLREHYQTPFFLTNPFEGLFNLHYEFVKFDVMQDDMHQWYGAYTANKFFQKIKKVFLLINKNIQGVFENLKEKSEYGHSVSSFLLVAKFDSKSVEQKNDNYIERNLLSDSEEKKPVIELKKKWK